eukprot:6166572-Pyramimonas_sp.AAC.1
MMNRSPSLHNRQTCRQDYSWRAIKQCGATRSAAQFRAESWQKAHAGKAASVHNQLSKEAAFTSRWNCATAARMDGVP